MSTQSDGPLGKRIILLNLIKPMTLDPDAIHVCLIPLREGQIGADVSSNRSFKYCGMERTATTNMPSHPNQKCYPDYATLMERLIRENNGEVHYPLFISDALKIYERLQREIGLAEMVRIR